MSVIAQTPVVGIGTPCEYMGRTWKVTAILKTQVVLTEIVQGEFTSRTTRVDHSVFEKLI